MSGSPFIPKQYGLILPGAKKINAPAQRRPVARLDDFDDLDDDDGDNGDAGSANRRPINEVERRLEAQRVRTLQSTQLRETLQQAIAEDPTVFDYDAAFDNISEARVVEKADEVARKPKYVEALLQKAEERKVERERVVIRTIQRERQREGEVFADKEEFVTEAYKQKLQEEREREEEEKRRGTRRILLMRKLTHTQ